MKVRRIYTPDEIDAARDAVTVALLAAGNRQRGATIRFSCPVPTHDDRDPSASWNVEKGAWLCFSRQCHQHYGGGTMALAALLGVTVGGDLPPETIAAADAARAVAAAELARTAAEHEATLDRLIESRYDVRCVSRLWQDDEAMGALAARGITRDCAAALSIGLDDAAPVGGRWRAYVWPWMIGCTPVSFQYRNTRGDGGDSRYRWHGAVGQNGARLYWHPAATSRLYGDQPEPERGPLIVVEGFLKLATLWTAGWQNVAAFVNSGSLDSATAERLARLGDEVIIAPDPDAHDAMFERARAIPGARVAMLPAKPDDLIVYGGADVLRRYLSQARAA